MKNLSHRISAVLLLAAGMLAQLAPADSAVQTVQTTVWIGGENGSVRNASNWDNGYPYQNSLMPYFTNSVTFAEEDKTEYWRPMGVRLADGITVTANTRDMPEVQPYIPDGKWVFDIGTGSKYVNNYVFYGKPGLTLVKKGKGTLQTYWCGSGNNRFDNIDVQEGVLYTGYSAECRLIPLSNLFVRANAEVEFANKNIFATNGPLITVEAGGVLDGHNLAHTWPGLAGNGTVTNGGGGIRLTLEHSGKVFSGDFHGKMIVKPDLNFAKPGSYCVIGGAYTLADAELEIADTEGFENPVRFAAGIGTFHVKKFPDRRFFDVNGEPVTLIRSGRKWYVDASRTETQGEGDGTSPATAFRTLKAAMENERLAEYDTVYALPGVYSNGVMGTDTTLNRVIVPENVWLVSRDGADSTFISGAIATNIVDNHGSGTGAVRCVSLKAGSRLEGFTLINGRVNTTPNNATSRGGGVLATDTSAFIVDCVFSNNVARRGGAGHNGTWIRCRAYYNRCTEIGSVWNDHCNLYNCVTDWNIGSYSYYVATMPSKIVNCVFGPNEDGSIRATGDAENTKAHFYNTVFLTDVENADRYWEPGRGSVFHRCLFAYGTDSDYVYEDCIITNLSAVADRLAFAGLGADLRPMSLGSAVVDAGRNVYMSVTDMLNATSVDLDRNPRIQGKSIDIGAFEYDWHEGAVSISAPGGGMEIVGANIGPNVVRAGETLTFTLKRKFDSALLCAGFTTNGIFVAFDDFPDGFCWTVDGDDFSTAVAVEAVYVRATDWYVDSVNGNDANPGYHALCPKRTLVEVMTNTAVASGDTVWAAPGWYTNGVEVIKDGSYFQGNRVAVKSGVTLKSTNGADETFIGGEIAAVPVESARGCGEGAVRCVYLQSGAVLSGFTLTNGYTVCESKNSGVMGGGVSGGTVEDCIIRNCTAVRGGGVHNSVCRRCRFIDNSAAYIGAAANASTLANCFFNGNTNGSYTTLNCTTIRNCTFLPDNSTAVWISSAANYTPSNVCNSVILCHGAVTNVFTRCLVSKESKTDSKWLDEHSVMMNIADMGLDENGRPVSGSSAAVDMGGNEDYAFVNAGDRDMDGNQRIYNGVIDAGCWEYDWRRDFAGRLGSQTSLSVTSASPSVTTNDVGGLRLSGDGCALNVRWTDAGVCTKRYAFTAEVTGTGTLAVYRDGAVEPWTVLDADDGQAGLIFNSAAAENRLSFVFSGDGFAELSSFAKIKGTVVIIR